MDSVMMRLGFLSCLWTEWRMPQRANLRVVSGSQSECFAGQEEHVAFVSGQLSPN